MKIDLRTRTNFISTLVRHTYPVHSARLSDVIEGLTTLADVGSTHQDLAIASIDIGATSIKVARVSPEGRLLDPVRRLETPYPCTPEGLLRVVTDEILRTQCSRAAVGFPGDMDSGRVLEPGNLSRAGGISTPIDPEIDAAWTGFDIEGELRERTGLDVRVVNDATLAAYGYHGGVGRELVVTLGTGFGISLFVDGEWMKIRDVGAAPFHGWGSYDEVGGEPARVANEILWRERILVAVIEFAREFRADSVHVGGGNARFFTEGDFSHIHLPVELNNNEGTLAGAARLFRSRFV